MEGSRGLDVVVDLCHHGDGAVLWISGWLVEDPELRQTMDVSQCSRLLVKRESLSTRT